MESESKRDKIVEILEQIFQLLIDNQNRWAKAIKSLLDNYVNLTHSKTKEEAARLIITSLVGGMGSFSDLVLHKNGKPLIEENNKLEALRTALFQECMRLQSESEEMVWHEIK